MSTPATTHPTRLVAGLLLRRTRWLGGWWLIMTLLAVGLVAVLAAFDNVEFSGWATFNMTATKYWMLVFGSVITAGYLRPMVANGITRRDFALGAGAYGLLVTLAFAVIGVLGFGVERAVYDAAGWLSRLDDPYPVNSLGDAARQFGLTAVLYLAYLVVGWLVSTNFYRYGRRLGIALLLPSIVPAVVPEVAFGIAWADTTGGPLPYGAALAASFAAVGAGLVALHLVLRDVPIRSQPA